MSQVEIESPLMGINISEVVSEKVNPKLKTLKRVLQYFSKRTGGQVKLRTDYNELEVMIKNARVEVKPYETRIILSTKDEVWIRTEEKGDEYDDYDIEITLMIVDEDLFTEYEDFIDVEFKGYIEVETKGNKVMMELRPKSLVQVW